MRGWAAGLGQSFEQIGPDALGRPTHEPVVKRLLRAVDLPWRIRPTLARLQHVDDALDYPAVIDPFLALIFEKCASVSQNSLIRSSFPTKEAQTVLPNQIYGSRA